MRSTWWSKDRDGDTVLVDWKTSAAKWPEGKVYSHMQATCFTYGWSRLTGNNPLFRFDVVTKTKKPSYETLATTRREDDFHRLAELVRVVERAIAHDVFYPMHGGYACKDWPPLRRLRQLASQPGALLAARGLTTSRSHPKIGREASGPGPRPGRRRHSGIPPAAAPVSPGEATRSSTLTQGNLFSTTQMKGSRP